MSKTISATRIDPQARTPTLPAVPVAATTSLQPRRLRQFERDSTNASALAPTTTLITGATGFIGGACAVEALAAGRVDELLFLVRAASAAEGLQRVRQSLLRFAPPGPLLERLSERQIVLGDLADVDGFAADPRLDRVTHVLNCAAVASFGDHPGIWPVNVVGTVAFARRMARDKRLRRFVHIGTAMACGTGMVSPVVEAGLSDAEARHLVPYTESKAEAERQMRTIENLPLVVARPSIVVGHTQLGCKPSTSIFWVFRMAHDLGHWMCDLDETVDVVPVDYCARALLLLLFKPQIANDLYHISAGGGSATFREIEKAMAEARGIPSLGSNFRHISEQDIPSIVPEFKARLGICNRRLVVKAMKLYGGFARLNYQFDNQRLIAEGLAPPPSFPGYIRQCIASTEGLSLLDQMMDDFK
ncbi:SDR family oxidoreductase [Solimonas terrae]|uniref:NAD-dependent epimerase/dehydratase family protein n=1 Tax=Solimonas terrae TaxID=1396819 RepID=A0A6M2BUG4_9GAMM|nr:SDR family oxidoreductase [Solimonas terrae]NGY06000.1 NAD-dependent epimerase/dehydratase family protein [Solimonas terrae]